MLLLSEGMNALPVLALTLTFPELVSSTLAILLSLAFLSSESTLDQFVSLMCEPVTFEVFQHSLQQHRHSKNFDDFIVILQKLTVHDPATLKTLMSTRLIETLN